MISKSEIEYFYIQIFNSYRKRKQIQEVSNIENLIELMVEILNENGYYFTREEVKAAVAVEIAIRKEYVNFKEPSLLLPLVLRAFETINIWKSVSIL